MCVKLSIYSLSGKPPFKGKNYYDLLKKNYVCEFKFHFKYWHGISEEGKIDCEILLKGFLHSKKSCFSHDGP